MWCVREQRVAEEMRQARALFMLASQVFLGQHVSDAAEALEGLLRCLDTALLPPMAGQSSTATPTLLKRLCGLCVDEVSSLLAAHVLPLGWTNCRASE